MMKRRIILFFLFFIAAILEISFLPNIMLAGVAADLVLITLIIWFGGEDFDNFWIWAVVAGLILDLLSFSPLGLNSFSFLVIAFSAGYFLRRFIILQKKRTFLATWAVVLGATLVYFFLLGFLRGLSVYFAGEGVVWGNVFDYKIIFFKLVNNSLILLVIFWPLSRIREILYPKDSGPLIK